MQNRSLVAQIATVHGGELVEHHDLVLGQNDEVSPCSGMLPTTGRIAGMFDTTENCALAAAVSSMTCFAAAAEGRQRATKCWCTVRVAFDDIGA